MDGFDAEGNVDLDAMFKQMREILEEQGTVTQRVDTGAIPDLEDRLTDMIRHKLPSAQWKPDHELECCCETCSISPLVVVHYSGINHLCAELPGRRLCDDPTNQKTHSGQTKKDLKTYFLCETTGVVHQCGEGCRASKYITNHDNEYVCPISGLVLGVEMKGEWWQEKGKQPDISSDEPEPDKDMLEVLNPTYVTRKSYDAQGNLKITKEHAYKDVVVTHHLHYHTTPYEKMYGHYLKRCKTILWLLIYSAKRQQIERQKLNNSYTNMQKGLDKYIRSCEKGGNIKEYHFIRVLLRQNMKAKADIPVWLPPLRIMEALLFHYSRIIVKFFWMILEKTPFGRTCHTQLPFDYFVLATIKIMKTRGLIVRGITILPKDHYLAAQIPDSGSLVHFNIKVSFITKTQNHINAAVGEVDAKILQVQTTDRDMSLFGESRERRLREVKDAQFAQKTETNKDSTEPVVKRRKKQ